MQNNKMREEGLLRTLKDKFIRFWPNLGLQLVNIDEIHLERQDRVLVVGSGRIDKVAVRQQVNIDIRAFPGVDIVADGQQLPFKDESFDAVVCHQVLEHVLDVDLAIREIYYVLKSNGKVIVDVPFFFPFHASPHDYRRWTIPGLEFSFRAFKSVDTGIYIGPVSAFLTAFQYFIGAIVPNFWLSYLVRSIVGYLLFPFKYLDLLVARSSSAIYIAASVYYVGVKEGKAE